MHQTFSIVSGCVTLLALVPYIRSILRGDTRPNRVTWWIWLSVNSLLASTYYAVGARAGLWLAISSVAGQLIVAALSVKRGTGGASTLDRLCLLAAGGVAVLWYFSSSALLPHYLTVVIDFCGWLPTFAKTVSNPRSENRSSWGLWTLGGFFAVLAIRSWSLSEAAYPVYILVSDGIVFLLTFRASIRREPARRRAWFTATQHDKK